MNNKVFTNTMLDELREKVSDNLSAERFAHTLGVERAAVKIGQAMCPELLPTLSSAALLHDVTKEYSFEKQLKTCRDFGIILRDDEIGAPAVLHAITAAAIIPVDYPEFADDTVIGSVRWHTTGHPGMTLPEKIIHLADYIEEGRAYPACRAVAKHFWDAFEASKNATEMEKVIDAELLELLTNTVDHIRSRGGIVNLDTLATIDYITNNK